MFLTGLICLVVGVIIGAVAEFFVIKNNRKTLDKMIVKLDELEGKVR